MEAVVSLPLNALVLWGYRECIVKSFHARHNARMEDFVLGKILVPVLMVSVVPCAKIALVLFPVKMAESAPCRGINVNAEMGSMDQGATKEYAKPTFPL